MVQARTLPSRELQIPIAGMTVPNFTHINKKLDPADTPKGFSTNDNTFVEETSVFYGGQIYCNFGAFVTRHLRAPWQQFGFWTTPTSAMPTRFKLGETDVVYGVTANNNPTVQDPWNTTPAWSFPFIAASDALAPVPSAGTMPLGVASARNLPDRNVRRPPAQRTAASQKNLSQNRSGTVLTSHWKLREKAPVMTTKVMMLSSVAAIVQNALAIFSKAPRARLRSW